MDQTVEERRRSRRVAVEDIPGVLKFSSEARVLNLSVTGMAVRTGTHLRVGQTTDVRLGTGGEAVRLAGTVVWSKLVGVEKSSTGDAAPVYEAGFEFESVFSQEARQLLGLMGDTGAVTPQTRLAGRFEPAEGETAGLRGTTPFRVSLVSAHGLLIETDAALPRDTEVTLDLRHRGETLTARARVAYVEEPLADSAPHRIGLEFIDLPPAGARLVSSLFGTTVEPEG